MLREAEDLEEPVIMCEVTSRWWTISFANKNARKLSRCKRFPCPYTNRRPYMGCLEASLP